MIRFRVLLVTLLLTLAWCGHGGGAAFAQQVGVTWCNSSTLPCPSGAWLPTSSGNPLPISGSFSASGFAPATTGSPISVTTGGVTGNLPAGAVVAAFNVGATNTAYCKLGASSTTNDIAIPPQSWFAYTVGAATQMTCITSVSTTTVNLIGGSGLPAGAGGGGGSSAGGAVFGPTAVGSANANPPVVIGGTATGAAGQNVEGLAIKPASTASVAADLSAVTNESPNSQLSVATGTSADSPAAVPTSSTAASQIALLKALNNTAASAIPLNKNGTATGQTGATIGTAQTGTQVNADVGINTVSNTALANYGSAPGSVPALPVNAAITNTPALGAGTSLIGNTGQVYPAGSTPITASTTGTTAATTATLAANASLHTYICGFSIRANATAAATGNATVTGMVTGTTNWTQWTAPLASGLGVTEEVFSPCIISSAINTGIAVISAAPGAGGVVSVSAWGYQL